MFEQNIYEFSILWPTKLDLSPIVKAQIAAFIGNKKSRLKIKIRRLFLY